MEEKVYIPKDVWKLLKIGRTRFYQLLKGGKIGYYKNCNRYLIPQSAIEKFISEQTAQYMEGGEQE